MDEDENDSSEDEEEEPQARYGDNEYELVLPSGTRLGHRAMRRYYNQSLRPRVEGEGGAGSGGALARRLIADGRGGGRNANGGGELAVRDRGGQVIQARSKGEARELKRYQREFRDVQRREQPAEC